MELSKFGPILKFAIDLERRAAEFYEAAAAVEPSPQLEQSAAATRQRLSRLELMRRELVNEILLEPIAGFRQPPLPDLEVSCADRGRMVARNAGWRKQRLRCPLYGPSGPERPEQGGECWADCYTERTWTRCAPA